MARRRRAWWGRRPFKAAAYDHAHHLHRFEDEVILDKLADRSLSAWDLDREHPELFNVRNLKRALHRMHKDGLLTRQRQFGSFHRGAGWRYTAKQPVRRAA